MIGLPMNWATNKLAGSKYKFCGSSSCCTTPSFNRIILSLIDNASSWSWVTKIVVIPTSLTKRRISSRIFKRNRASKLLNGSSSSKTSGFCTKARVIATRCCCPPESVPGFLFRNSPMFVNSIYFSAIAMASAFGFFLSPTVKGHVIINCHMWIKRIVLEHKTDIPVFRFRFDYRVPRKTNIAVRRAQQTSD